MFGNKKKPKNERKVIYNIPAGQDIYTAPEDRMEDESIESLTADEALNKSLDNPRYELLKNEIFREINKAIEKGYGRIKFKEYFSVDDVNSERLKNYFIALGYKAWLADSEVHFNGESVLFLNISWIDIDEVTGEMKL